MIQCTKKPELLERLYFQSKFDMYVHVLILFLQLDFLPIDSCHGSCMELNCCTQKSLKFLKSLWNHCSDKGAIEFCTLPYRPYGIKYASLWLLLLLVTVGMLLLSWYCISLMDSHQINICPDCQIEEVYISNHQRN